MTLYICLGQNDIPLSWGRVSSYLWLRCKWLETAAYHDPNLPHKEKFVKFAKISFLVMEACTSMPVFISTRKNWTVKLHYFTAFDLQTCIMTCHSWFRQQPRIDGRPMIQLRLPGPTGMRLLAPKYLTIFRPQTCQYWNIQYLKYSSEKKKLVYMHSATGSNRW